MSTLEPAPRKPLRLWPGVVAALLLIAFKLVMPLFGTAGLPTMFLGSLAGGALILLWWVFLSRAPWVERLGAIVVMILAIAATLPFLDPSIAAAGQGRLFYILVVPVVALALVAAAVVSRRFGASSRRAVIVVAIGAASGSFALLRTGGVTGGGDTDIHFRWTPTAEERLLAQVGDEPPPRAPKPAPVPDEAKVETAELTPTTAPLAAPRAAPPDRITHAPAEWPGFRGPNRDNVIRGIRVETDWSQKPPVELWRRAVGPGWSSFAVHGDLIYTQEQRGEDEVVSCYRLSTGEPVWRHRDAARFSEFPGGPGPRATPTVHNGRVYTHGATGIVNALDARTGARIWTRSSASDTGAEPPGWGFTSSPLVVNDLLVVAASGVLVAYDLATGRPQWQGPRDGGGYSSPQLVVLDGVPQIVLLRGRRTTGFDVADGQVLWEHSWQPGASIVQPALIGTRDLLINHADTMGGQAMRRLLVTRAGGDWHVGERWTSRSLKPYFNDFVVHEGHAFGFDGSILSCIDIDDGERTWKGGRYGHGQMLLLAEQDLLLVLSEEGELALVNATPDHFTEVTRFKAIEGKTWNHPVLVGDVLLVRNGEEMAA
ncbi:MAG TPA: PQQ-binding-like beta-propeller repeat protein, partial [Vicinamibacterales bacterium]|nr:PQQ-binding-like beta-propeller repeat protein [Vicinamibacterales bacterium]